MRLIDADEAKKLERMVTLTPSERALFKLMLDRMPTYEPPNPPLTMEELREMDGEPVWVVQSEVDGCWALISAISSAYVHTYRCGVLVIKEYGETWWAYRRKPEEGTK